MTRDDIIRLAEESGLEDGLYPYGALWESIERFAILVAAAEREACAEVCERISKEFVFEPRSPDPVYCADAIRARGEDK